MNSPVLQLSADDVRRALPMREAIEAMREAFGQLARGEVTLAPRQRIDAPAEGGVALVMSCHSASARLFSVKFITLFDHNDERGLPRIHSTVLLSDGCTGAPVAMLDGASLTAIRTGAAAGLATDLLARADAASVAILGAGVQARTQLEGVCGVRRVRRAWVYDPRGDVARRFAQEMGQQLGIAVELASSASAAVREAEIVCTVTTSATPVFEDRDVQPGTHINAVGVFKPEMAEIPAQTVRRARVVVDHRESAMEEAGDLLIPLRAGLIGEAHFATELGELVLGRQPGRTSAAQITLFKSVGVAIQDLVAAARAVANVRRRSCQAGERYHGAE